MWWLGIRLVSLLSPPLLRGFLLIHTFTISSWVSCHHFATFHLKEGVRIIHLWTRQLQTLNWAQIPSSLIPSRHQNRKHPLMSLLSLLLQSLQGFFTWLVQFLILLNYSLLLASGLINYGDMQGHFFTLFLLPPICQHRNWFDIFLVTQQHIGFQSSTPPDNITLNPTSRKVLTPELHLLIPFPVYKNLREEWFLFQKYAS